MIVIIESLSLLGKIPEALEVKHLLFRLYVRLWGNLREWESQEMAQNDENLKGSMDFHVMFWLRAAEWQESGRNQCASILG